MNKYYDLIIVDKDYKITLKRNLNFLQVGRELAFNISSIIILTDS